MAAAAKRKKRYRHAPPSMPQSDQLGETARVVDGGGAAMPQGVVVEVAVAVNAIVAPVADALSPGFELVVLEEVAALATVEAHVGPIGSQLHVQRNAPADRQTQRRVVLAQTIVHGGVKPALMAKIEGGPEIGRANVSHPVK